MKGRCLRGTLVALWDFLAGPHEVTPLKDRQTLKDKRQGVLKLFFTYTSFSKVPKYSTEIPILNARF